ncbi:MAG: YidC/Oxa1 family membrane protein insertase [Patescibacteria group bacterium]
MVLYETVGFHDLGVAIIVLTLLIRFILYPLSGKAIASQKNMMTIQPEVKAIQEKYKNNKEEAARRMMALYKERKVNPLSGCLPILIQLPVLIALYWVFLAGFDDESLASLYGFIPSPGPINHMFLGIFDLAANNPFLAVLAGIAQFYQSKMVLDEQKKRSVGLATNDFSLALSKNMTYMMPVATVLITYSLHAGIALYWITTTLFSVAQQWRMFRAAPER